jgi:hypothetical protein
MVEVVEVVELDGMVGTDAIVKMRRNGLGGQNAISWFFCF